MLIKIVFDEGNMNQNKLPFGTQNVNRYFKTR